MIGEAKEAVAAPGKLVVADVPHAPFIFFDEAPMSGILPGMVTITLSAKAVTSNGSKVEAKDVVVAYLRCNRAAAVALRRAIDKALLMGEPTPGAAN